MESGLLELSYLTACERNHLLSVLDADEQLRVRRIRIFKGSQNTSKPTASNWPPSAGQDQNTTIQQIKIKLEIEHIYCSELLRNSLKAALDVSREIEETRENAHNHYYGSNGTLHDYKGDYEISGQVLLGVYFKDNELCVHVNRASGLASADNNGYSDPYIKIYLLPDKAKQTKRKTTVKKRTLSPVYNEILKYKPSEFDVNSHTLWLSVWDWDRFTTNQFLGEIHIPLCSLNVSDTSDHWYQLQDKGGGSQTTLPNSFLASMREGGCDRQSLVSKCEPSPLVSALSNKTTTDDKLASSAQVYTGSVTRRPPVNIVSEEKGSQQTRASRQRARSATPSLVGQVASFLHEDIHIKRTKSSSTDALNVQTDVQPLDISKVHVLVSSAENEQTLPQFSSVQRPRQTESSSLAGSHLSLYDSTTSVYREVGGRGDYIITGEVMFALSHNSGELHVYVERARGLAATDSKGFSNPYIKTYLLPDKEKRTKQKTSIKKKTLDPVYNETLTHKVDTLDLPSRTLWLSVWDWDKFGRNQFLGEIRLPLSSADLTISGSQWHPLQDKDGVIAAGDMATMFRGELKISLKFNLSEGPNGNGTLVIDVKQAKGLPVMKGDTTNSVVKLYLLPNRKSSGKRRTGVIKNNLNPVWEEKFTFEDVTLDELSYIRALEVSVWNYDNFRHTFIGGVRIGPTPGSGSKQYDWMDSVGDEVSHWEDMLACPGEWVEQWHTLRTTLNPRKIYQPIATPPSSLCISRTPSAEDSLDEGGSPPRAAASRRDTISHPEESISHSPYSSQLGLNLRGSVGSLGSMTSIYSEAGEKGNYDITGEIQVGVYYKEGELCVHVNRAEGLAGAKSSGFSDPYFKTYLLPDKLKCTKKKTSVKRKTLDPVYDETLKYKLPESELSSRVLWLSAWDWDRFGRNQFLGEVRFPLSSVDLNDVADKWYFMQDMDVESNLDEMYRGQLKIALKYSPDSVAKKSREQGTLHIAIKQAKDFQEPVDSFVKLLLLPDKSSKGKRKTKIIKSSMKPTWQETFTYEKVQLDDLSFQRTLELAVWNFHKRSGNVFIGGLRIGPAPGSAAKHKDWMDSIGAEVTHWEDMLASPGQWVEQWHTLRTTMNPRDVMLPY